MLLKIIYEKGVEFVKVVSVVVNEKQDILEYTIISNDFIKRKENINLIDEKVEVVYLDEDIIFPRNQKTNLVDFLKEKMVIHKLSQKELAQFLEISHPTLNYVMSGKRVAGDKIMRQIARKFGLTLSEVREMREMENNIKGENK